MIDSYYASYSLEYYEEGHVYSFYMKKGEKLLDVANEESVKKFAKRLENLEEDHDSYPPAGIFTCCQRACGVVVEKIQGNNNGSYDKIRVMFKAISEEGEVSYKEKSYVVNYTGVSSDGWDRLPVQTYITAESIVTVTGGSSKSGRVTVDDTKGPGRVTVDDEKNAGEKEDNGKSGSKTSNNGSGKVTVDDVTGVTLDEE